MTPEQQRVTILEAIGWTDLSRTGRRGDDGPLGALRGTSPDMKKYQIAPNPLVNLNAMHEAEKALPEDKRLDYWLEISKNSPRADKGYWYLVHATAAQRAEAFLRAVGRWEG